MFNELCATGRTSSSNTSTASPHHRKGRVADCDTATRPAGRLLRTRPGDRRQPRRTHRRIATEWITHHAHGHTVAITTAANEQVDAINAAIQTARLGSGHLNPDLRIAIGGGEHAQPGDVVATRRNDRTLVTDADEPVRNRELWTVTDTHPDGAITVTHVSGHGTVTLPAEYARLHVRLGYAATEHGNQSDTVTVSTELVTPATTRRGLYVGVTRGQQENTIRVVTDSHDLDEARDVLEAVLATDRVDIPAVTQRRQLAAALPSAPAPRPRCVIPNWFDDTYHHAAAELADAHEAMDEQRRQDARIDRRIRDLTDDLNELQPRCDPYDTAITAAHDDVNQAQGRKRHAERAVVDSGTFGRRAARRDLTDATDELADTQTARRTHSPRRPAPRPTQPTAQRTRPPPPTRHHQPQTPASTRRPRDHRR